MRQENREIKEFNEIIEVMKNCDVCRLALNDDEYPYILPLNFGMEIVDGKKQPKMSIYENKDFKRFTTA